MIRRDDYMKLLYAGMGDNDVTKVVTGMRRCGKSTLIEMFMDELIKSGVNRNDVFHLELESEEGLRIVDYVDLNKWLSSIPADRQTYLFLDEIQNVDGWEKSVAMIGTMHNCDLYITGSNSAMLSSELSTHISGRFVEIRMLPLSFKEYLQLHRSNDVRKSFNLFLKCGALPGLDPGRGERYSLEYLDGVLNTVMMRDVLDHKGLRSPRKLKSVARFLYSNIGNTTNNSIIAKESDISATTADSYIEGLQEALLFYYAERYDIIGKRLMNTNGKYYASDLGLRTVALGGASGTDISRPVENVVFLELIRRGYVVHVGSFKDSEIDFIATRNGIVEYYQVTLTMLASETREREFRPLRGIEDNWKKTILTMDDFGLGFEDGVEIINLIDWLLGKA